jgi:hypothetical protein
MGGLLFASDWFLSLPVWHLMPKTERSPSHCFESRADIELHRSLIGKKIIEVHHTAYNAMNRTLG